MMKTHNPEFSKSIIMKIIATFLYAFIFVTCLNAQNLQLSPSQATDSIKIENIVHKDTISPAASILIDSLKTGNTATADSTGDDTPLKLRAHTVFIYPMALFELLFSSVRRSPKQGPAEPTEESKKPKEKRPLPKTYDPQLPTIWYGTSLLHDGITGSNNPDFHLRDGVKHHHEFGVTGFEISKNWYKNAIGISAAVQLYGGVYHFDRNYILKRSHKSIEFVETKAPLKTNKINYAGLRFPILVGYQTPYKIFSIKTGLALGFRGVSEKTYTYKYKEDKEKSELRLHLNWLTTDWMTVIGLGPVTLTYKQGLLHLFKTASGKKAYESSLTFGLDLHWLFRLKWH